MAIRVSLTSDFGAARSQARPIRPAQGKRLGTLISRPHESDRLTGTKGSTATHPAESFFVRIPAAVAPTIPKKNNPLR